jgi:hypothetical protein
MLFSFNDESLHRHKVTRQEALEALEDPYKVEVELGEHKGNPTSLWVGKTFAERILEIGVEYLEDFNHIYHANKAKAKCAAQYGKQW